MQTVQEPAVGEMPSLAALDPQLHEALNSFRCTETKSCPPELRSPTGVWELGDFSFIRKLGQGFASHVYQAVHLRSGRTVAVKIYNKSSLTPLNKRQVEREIAIHSNLQHPNILDMYAAFEDATYVYLVLEFCERGDLFTELKRRRGIFSEALVVRSILHPFLHALRYLHSCGIIHRDIKPENLLFNEDKVLKIADFGLAIDKNEERPVTRLGTLDYMAPDVLLCPDKKDPWANKDLPGYHEGVDAWACGVLAYELLAGKSPFGRDSRRGTYDAILTTDPSFLFTMSEESRDFIQAALIKDARLRPTVERLLQHPFILKYSRKGSLPTHVVVRQSGGFEAPLPTPAVVRAEEAALEAAQAEATRRDSAAHVPFIAPVLVRPAPMANAEAQNKKLKTNRGEVLVLSSSGTSQTAATPLSPNMAAHAPRPQHGTWGQLPSSTTPPVEATGINDPAQGHGAASHAPSHPDVSSSAHPNLASFLRSQSQATSPLGAQGTPTHLNVLVPAPSVARAGPPFSVQSVTHQSSFTHRKSRFAKGGKHSLHGDGVGGGTTSSMEVSPTASASATQQQPQSAPGTLQAQQIVLMQMAAAAEATKVNGAASVTSRSGYGSTDERRGIFRMLQETLGFGAPHNAAT